MAELARSSQPGTAVVIPVGAVDEPLGRQLAAVLNQVYHPFEVVLSVNTSDPSALPALSHLLRGVGDRRVSIVDSSDRRGAAHARNVGARSTSAGRLVFCDADDRVFPGWLANLIAGLDHHDAVCGNVIDVFPSERMSRWHPPATPGSLPKFLGRPYVLTGNLAVRRAAFDAVGGFDERLSRCEDIAFGWSLLEEGCTLGFVPEASIEYHHRAGFVAMLRQHYAYGKGMSQVLRIHGVPDRPGSSSALKSLRPNGQRVARRTIGGFARRGALAVGRVRGMIPS